MLKKIFTILRSKFLFILTYDVWKLMVQLKNRHLSDLTHLAHWIAVYARLNIHVMPM